MSGKDDPRMLTGTGTAPPTSTGVMRDVDGRQRPQNVGRAEYIALLEQRVDQLEHRNAHLEDRLRAVTALQAVDQAFYKHTVAQRNHAWEDIRLLKITLEAARTQLATLARPR